MLPASDSNLLWAIAEGLVTRDSPRAQAAYLGPDQVIGVNQIVSLARRGLIDKPLSGAPRITVDGWKALAEHGGFELQPYMRIWY